MKGDQVQANTMGDWMRTQAAKLSEAEEIQARAIRQGRTKSVQERERFLELLDEIERIDAELKDMERLDAARKAVPYAASNADILAAYAEPR